MANKKILYFLAGAVATGPELTAIGQLNALTGYDVGIRNALVPNTFGAGVEHADFVAGTVPQAYTDLSTPSIDPATAANAVGATQVVLTSGVAKTGVTLVGTAGAGKSMVATIVAGAITTVTFT